MALRRVWSSVRISWYLTTLLHRFPGATDFDQRAQEYELEYLNSSHHAQVAPVSYTHLEQCELPMPICELQPNANGPNLFQLEGCLLTDELAFIPRSGGSGVF